jgi:MFS family permease
MDPSLKKLQSEKHAQEIKLSLSACIKEGVAAQIMIGIFDYYLVPFALLLHASTEQIGFLVSVPHLLASISQLFAVKAVEAAGGRKEFLMKGTFVQAVLLLPIGFLVFTYFPHRLAVLIFLVCIFRVLGSLLGPAWGSMVSSYLPENLRGGYFGRRAQIISIIGLINLSAWGLFLSWMNHFSVSIGFCVIFLTAAIVRFVSFYYMRQLTELSAEDSPENRFTFWMFIRRFRESNFVKYIFYMASITFATQLCAAYFSVYMLEDLKFSYLSYMLVNFASMLAGLLVFPIWGRHADMVGNAKIMKLTSLFIPVIPLFWVFAREPWQLILIESFSGFIWGGFNLCSANFIFDAVSAPKRVQCLGYFNLINGIAIFAGAGLGGYWARRLPEINGSSLLTLFLISAILRFLAHFLLSKHFTEVRTHVTSIRSREVFFSVLGVRPLIGRNLEWNIFPMKVARFFKFKK